MGTRDPKHTDVAATQVARCEAVLPSEGDAAPFAVLRRRLDAGWYEDLVAEITSAFEVEETTDLNYDRARHLVLHGRQDRARFQLGRSLWGRFASVSVTSPARFLEASEVPGALRRALDTHGVELLHPAALASPARDLDGSVASLWQVMFYAAG